MSCNYNFSWSCLIKSQTHNSNQMTTLAIFTITILYGILYQVFLALCNIHLIMIRLSTVWHKTNRISFVLYLVNCLNNNFEINFYKQTNWCSSVLTTSDGLNYNNINCNFHKPANWFASLITTLSETTFTNKQTYLLTFFSDEIRNEILTKTKENFSPQILAINCCVKTKEKNGNFLFYFFLKFDSS